MPSKGENEVVKVRKSGGATAVRLPRVVRSSKITARKSNTNADSKAGECSEGCVKISGHGVSINEHGKNGAKKTVLSAVTRLRIPLRKKSSVSVEGSSVRKHTAASLAKKEAKVAPEPAKVTRTGKIGEKADTLVQKTDLKTITKELSARQHKSEPPALSAKEKQTKPHGSTSKQPAKTTNPSPSIEPKLLEDSRKELLRKYHQISQEKRIQGEQPENEASTSKPMYHIEWNGFDEADEIGVHCCLCEGDLAVQPSEDNRNEYFTFPVVAILPCGHVFHADCLFLDDIELKPGAEPPCVFCESAMT